MSSRLLPAALALALTACPSLTPTPDGGAGAAPVVTSVSPTSGPTSGGTTVTLNGANFARGATVAFDAVFATNVTFETDKRLTAVSPAMGPGPVSVTVRNPDGRSSTLPAAFTFTGASTNRLIAEAVLVNPAETTDGSGAAMLPVVVTGHVQVAMVTVGAGAGAGVRAQVGFGTTVGATPAASDFTWSEATYTGDVDGPAPGDKARDAYAGTVSLPAPATGNEAIYFLAVRFSLDGGQSWTLADRDGAANGLLTTQLAKVIVTRGGIDWCRLGGTTAAAPPSVALRGAAAGPVVYGQVFKAGITNASGAGTGIKGALGYGAPGTAPSTWTWVDATFNVDTGGGANDEFQATLPNPGPGTFKFAFRFNHADGPWAYCDADGLATNGFTEDQAGTLAVTDVGVDSCKLQFPATLSTFEGRPSELVFGRVFVQGLTEAVGAGPGIEGQLGYGATTALPSDPSWAWTNAAYNVDDVGGGDEYQARLTGPAPGAWAYAYRFRLDGGSWTYCDRDPTNPAVQPAELGALTAAPFDVTECVLEAANAQQTLLPGSSSRPLSVLVTVPTLTDAVGQGTPLTVQVGTGPAGAAPSTWTSWSNAAWVDDAAAADRYAATVTAPGTAGAAAVAFRVQVGSRPFVYCDLDGAQNGFSAAQAGQVTASSAFISSCTLNAPSAFAIASGDRLVVSARAQVPGSSASAGATPTLRVQVGVGPRGDNASTSALWGWQDAVFSGDVADGGEDEFSADTFPAYTGNRAVSARASLDGGAWTYCDLNGSATGGYEVNQQYDVTVGNHALLDYCDTRLPGFADAGATVYGQVYEPGLTPSASAPLIAQLGLGVESEDPGVAWRWSAATYNAGATGAGNNNEYLATIPRDAGAGLRYAFRFSTDAGSWCYGDLQSPNASPGGSSDGFSGGASIGLVVP